MEALFALLKSDANAANALGALASAIAAVLALFLSCVSVWISISASRSQRRHNELSVRPLAEVTVADYENSLRVKLRNNGSGPMIVIAVTVSDGSNSHESLIDWMPTLPPNRSWNTFTHALQRRTLQAGAEIILLELTEYDGEQNFSRCRDKVRKALTSLTVNVEYMDIYESVMKPCRKSLSWFGRNL
ncbi:hypothetical protein [Hydrogenophaga crassostreae]|uniref:hypothetical protein n=1 Tax=Hydrogenophaga crassostreae TaxID=1763535 RepID=UPI000B0EC440|nr:hypothetical protein [Hydrogenophaga crassostreae]